MRLIARLAAATLAASCLVAGALPLLAADTPAPAVKTPETNTVAAPSETPKVEEGFTPIFNGKDLNGWVYGTAGVDKDGKPKLNKAGVGYQVKDGSVYCTKTDGGNLYTEKEYANFVLRFEFRLTESANNGIGIRAPLTGDSAYKGMEIQVLDDNGKEYKKPDGTKWIRPEQHHGSIYDVFAAKQGFQKPVGEWNEEEIKADDRHITITLNGTVIVDADLDTVKDEAKLKKHPGLLNKTGHIGFLGHGHQVDFRNLRIKELPEAK